MPSLVGVPIELDVIVNMEPDALVTSTLLRFAIAVGVLLSTRTLPTLICAPVASAEIVA